MNTVSDEVKAQLEKKYPIGAIVELVDMDDVKAPPIGTRGIVQGIDSIGSILVAWETGSSLSVLLGVDSIKVIEKTPES